MNRSTNLSKNVVRTSSLTLVALIAAMVATSPEASAQFRLRDALGGGGSGGGFGGNAFGNGGVRSLSNGATLGRAMQQMVPQRIESSRGIANGQIARQMIMGSVPQTLFARRSGVGVGIGVGGGRPTPTQPPRRVCPNPMRPAPPQVVVPTQPIQTPGQPVQTSPQPLSEVQQLVGAARKAFGEGQYERAVELLDQVVELVDDNSDAYQFRALSHFASQNYNGAAADAYDALLHGNTWNWQAVRDLYPKGDIYVNQLRELETATRAEADLPHYFLLGYHYLVLGHMSEGKRELSRALDLQPEEPLIGQLVAVVSQMEAEKEQSQ